MTPQTSAPLTLSLSQRGDFFGGAFVGDEPSATGLPYRIASAARTTSANTTAAVTSAVAPGPRSVIGTAPDRSVWTTTAISAPRSPRSAGRSSPTASTANRDRAVGGQVERRPGDRRRRRRRARPRRRVGVGQAAPELGTAGRRGAASGTTLSTSAAPSATIADLSRQERQLADDVAARTGRLGRRARSAAASRAWPTRVARRRRRRAAGSSRTTACPRARRPTDTTASPVRTRSRSRLTTPSPAPTADSYR